MTDAAPDDAVRPGIPGLELQDKIGEGGMSVVYRAVHLNLQRGVAVKVLRAPADGGPSAPDWLRESRLMASLAHPHVVAIHDAGQVGGHSYLVLEYMAGGSLRSRMEPGRPWPLADAVAVLDRIAGALEHIHERGVLHLDLKPENILFAADGQIKVTDFGLAALHADARALLGGRHYQGTIDYSAPEQRSGQALDGRYDVFSLATLAYELLTGRLPGRVYVPASRRNPRLPAAIDGVLRRGLVRNPQERYPTVAAFRAALAAACPRRPRRRAWPVGVAAVAGLAALALLLLNGGPAPRPPAEPLRLWVLHDGSEDLVSLPDEVAAERILADDQKNRPPELALPVWPTPLPALVVRSPGAWGFVHPLADRTLARRVVKDWPALLRAVVPAEKNCVRAGGFDGDCLAAGHRGGLWRRGDAGGEPEGRRVAVERPPDRGDGPALLLDHTRPKPGTTVLGCYQALTRVPAPGSVAVLRYRARASRGSGGLTVYAWMPVVVPPADGGPAARRVRRWGKTLDADTLDPVPDRWLYRSRAWVTPTERWQTYVVVFETPPFPTRSVHRNVTIDVAAGAEVWVDDVELFAWQPGGGP